MRKHNLFGRLASSSHSIVALYFRNLAAALQLQPQLNLASLQELNLLAQDID